jgi:alkylresorcinol/alkylpyrone synthase
MHAITSEYLARSSLTLDDIDAFLCHPGGAKVIDALECAFGTHNGALSDSRTVLRDYGNMSAATVMFVLDRNLARGDGWRRALLSSLGPGFTAAFVTLER